MDKEWLAVAEPLFFSKSPSEVLLSAILTPGRALQAKRTLTGDFRRVQRNNNGK
jgi:hypothetical protein